MMQGFRAVVYSPTQLHVEGVEERCQDIIDHAMWNGDVLVVTRQKGHKAWYSVGTQAYYPTSYALSRLVPISSKPQNSDKILREFSRQKRKNFEGNYRIEEIYLEFTPGRHRSMVQALCRLMHQHAAGAALRGALVPVLSGSGSGGLEQLSRHLPARLPASPRSHRGDPVWESGGERARSRQQEAVGSDSRDSGA